MDLENLPPAFFVVPLFLIVFPLFWSGIVFLLAHMGGWASLAQVYRFDGQFQGNRWSFQSGRFGLVNYNGVLTVGANQEGLYLKPFFLFQIGQPPLFIPWYDISVKEAGLLFKYIEFRFQRVPSVQVKLGRSLSKRLAKVAGEAWPKELGPLD